MVATEAVGNDWLRAWPTEAMAKSLKGLNTVVDMQSYTSSDVTVDRITSAIGTRKLYESVQVSTHDKPC